MENKTEQLLNRTFGFGVSVLKFLSDLPEHYIHNIIKRQLARAVTSIGANYEEAQAAESKRDFIHKVGIVCKEIRECHYWLRVLDELYTDKKIKNVIKEYISEAFELKKIFISIKLSAQKNNIKSPVLHSPSAINFQPLTIAP